MLLAGSLQHGEPIYVHTSPYIPAKQNDLTHTSPNPYSISNPNKHNPSECHTHEDPHTDRITNDSTVGDIHHANIKGGRATLYLPDR